MEEYLQTSASAAAEVKFVSEFRLELMYISLIVNVRSSFTHLYRFQMLVLLSSVVVNTNHFFCNKRINFLNPK